MKRIVWFLQAALLLVAGVALCSGCGSSNGPAANNSPPPPQPTATPATPAPAMPPVIPTQPLPTTVAPPTVVPTLPPAETPTPAPAQPPQPAPPALPEPPATPGDWAIAFFDRRTPLPRGFAPPAGTRPTRRVTLVPLAEGATDEDPAGAETDGVLVSSRDIAEPSFLRLVNTTDWEFNLDGTLRGAASPGAQINLTELTVTFLLPQNSIPNQTEKVAAHAINLTPRKEGVIAFLPGSEYPGFKVAILSASGGGTPFPFNWQPGIPFWFYRPNDSETAYGRNPSVIKIRDKWGQATFSWVGGPMGQVWDPGMCIAEATRNLPGCVQGPPVNALDGVASWTIPFND